MNKQVLASHFNPFKFTFLSKYLLIFPVGFLTMQQVIANDVDTVGLSGQLIVGEIGGIGVMVKNKQLVLRDLGSQKQKIEGPDCFRKLRQTMEENDVVQLELNPDQLELQHHDSENTTVRLLLEQVINPTRTFNAEPTNTTTIYENSALISLNCSTASWLEPIITEVDSYTHPRLVITEQADNSALFEIDSTGTVAHLTVLSDSTLISPTPQPIITPSLEEKEESTELSFNDETFILSIFSSTASNDGGGSKTSRFSVQTKVAPGLLATSSSADQGASAASLIAPGGSSVVTPTGLMGGSGVVPGSTEETLSSEEKIDWEEVHYRKAAAFIHRVTHPSFAKDGVAKDSGVSDLIYFLIHPDTGFSKGFGDYMNHNIEFVRDNPDKYMDFISTLESSRIEERVQFAQQVKRKIYEDFYEPFQPYHYYKREMGKYFSQ